MIVLLVHFISSEFDRRPTEWLFAGCLDWLYAGLSRPFIPRGELSWVELNVCFVAAVGIAAYKMYSRVRFHRIEMKNL